ncbi:tetratricopeptide repeat protein [Oribacterium sp. FC2011]|uniref:tetratricopeptide repeat protein n=1 Tax=Oribacterium sp. FC2011 TaxID=1408311 RepID=UPI0006791181|nr:tetratricopeptide repeat protein [Oribacterium sp. FC2011]
MEKKSSPILIISVVTVILLLILAGILVFFNLPDQRIRRMLKTANKYIAEENYDEAILTLQKMIEIDPKNEDLYVLLADTYEKNGDIDKEVEFLQEAVTMISENQKISEVLSDVYPDVALSESSGTYTDPVRLSMSSTEGSKIFYKIVGSDTYSKYSSPIDFGKNGEYSIEYYAVSKSGYEGEHKTATYVIKLDESKYHFNEWTNEADGRHYYDADGKSVTGWLQIGRLWYLFDKNGVMLTGLQDDKGKTYYLGTDGAMLTGWQEINGKKYYFDESGAMLKNQWIDDTYYVGADGAMLVNTVTPDGKKVGKDGKKVDESWKQAYIDVLNGGIYYYYDGFFNETRLGENPNCCWDYVFLNDDEIPELIGCYNSYDYIILTYSNKKIIGTGGAECRLKFNKNENLLYELIDFSLDHSRYSYRIDSKKGFILVHSLESGVDEYDYSYYDGYVDGISVTNEQLAESERKYFDESDMTTPEGKYTSNEMIEIINNM